MDNSTQLSFSLNHVSVGTTLPVQDSDPSRALPYALLFCLIVSIQVTSNIWRKRVPSQTKAPYEKALWYKHMDPILGLDVMWICAKALYRSNLLDMAAGLLTNYGGTFSYLSLGKQAILTIDPENIKAMLSERFQDFGVGVARKVGLRPLFGEAILNSDGAKWKVRAS
jgi:hypothetical protein